MTAFVFVTTMLAAAPTTIAVSPASACSPGGVLERELRRAPVRFVEGEAELTLRLDPEGGGHRLRVTDLEGVTAIERLLPTPSCDEAAVAAALIIDRALRDIVVRLPAQDGGARPRREVSTKNAGAGDPAARSATAEPGTTGVAERTTTSAGPSAAPPADRLANAAPVDAAKTPATDRGAVNATPDPTKTPAAKTPPTDRAAVNDMPSPTKTAATNAAPTDPARTTPPGASAKTPGALPPRVSPPTTRDSTTPDRDTTPETPPIPPPSRPPSGSPTTSAPPPIGAPARTAATEAPPVPPTGSAPPASAATRGTTAPGAGPPTPLSNATTTGPTPPPVSTPPSLSSAPPLVSATPAPVITDETSGISPAPSTVLVSTAREVAPPVEQHPRPSGPRFELTAGAGFSTPTPSTLSLLLSLDAAFRLVGPWRVGVLGAFSFGGSTPVIDEQNRTRGALATQSLFVLPHAMACLDTPVELCAGLRGGLRLSAGTAGGPFLFQTRTVFAPAPSLGPGARAAFAIGPVVIALDVTGLVNLATPALAVEGLATRVETPRFELLVHLSAGGRSR
ncbi:MAG: hypothetical protein JNJ54_29900 [Myxococcaceae bacterium]|nr:hypothetical protein [Myxococcaceae bacterium]